MSRDCRMEIGFSEPAPSVRAIITALRNGGWIVGDGKERMCLSPDDSFDWEIAATDEQAIAIVEARQHSLGRGGFVMTWQDTCIGGNIYFDEIPKLIASWDINRRILNSLYRVSDHSWYLERVLDSLAKSDLSVAFVNFYDL